MPTVPSPSPTTTRAVKLKRRPPLTTLATRLMVTTRSTYAFLSAAASRRLSRPPPWRSRRSLPPAPAPAPVPQRWGPGIRRSSSLGRGRWSAQCSDGSQGQPTLTGAVGDGGDAAVVLVAAAVEDDRLDAGLAGPLRDELADPAGLGGLVGLEHSQVGLHRGGRGQRAALDVVDDLHEDVPRRARDDQAGPRRRAGQLLADAQVATAARGDLALRPLHGQSHDLLTSLSDLAADLLAGVPHALALVRVGLAQLADVRGDLADLLLVDALHREAGRAVGGEGDALGRLHGDGVAVAEGELEVRARGLHPVSRADDLEPLLVARRHALHHVGDERAGQAVQRAAAALVVRALDGDRAVLRTLHDEGLGDAVRQGALGTLDDHVAAVDGDLDPGGDGHGESTDARHGFSSLTRRRRGLPHPRPSVSPADR